MPKLEIELQPSRYLAILLLVTHIISLLAISLARLPLFIQLIAATIILLSLLYTFSRYVWLITPHAVNKAIMTEDSDWQVKWQGHYSRATLLAQQSYLSDGLILLNFRLAEGHRGKVINLFILPDSLAADSIRQLRVRLLMV